MLGHYSGMGDYDLIAASYEGEKLESNISLKSAAGGPFRLGNEDYITIKEFYDIVKKVKLNHIPGSTYEYSNLAYFLFSMLVEEVTGQTLRQYTDERIFKPLNMNKTSFIDNGTDIIKKRASGYAASEDGGYITDMTNLYMVGDGGLHTSVNEFFKWDQNFYSSILGKNPEKLMNAFNTPPENWKFEEPPYANGQNAVEIDGRKAFTHSGGWLGTSTFYMRFPDDQFSVVTLCNDVNQEPGKHSNKIATLFFETQK
jgi:CubicO group peptidase (beta-lactamase class C family)